MISPNVISAIIATVGVSIMAIETARVVDVERRRWGICVDYVVGRCRRMIHASTAAAIISVAWRHSRVSGHLVLVTSGSGHLLLIRGGRCHWDDVRGGSHLGDCGGRIRAGRGMVHATVRYVGHMRLRTVEDGGGQFS